MVRVLIAEDEWLVSFTLRELLERRGCDVVGVVTTGTDAVEMCCSANPDVVLMDIRMPGLDGVGATRQIMQECPTGVVVLTAHGEADQVAMAEAAGAMGYLVKPVQSDQMLAAIEIAQRRFAEFRCLREEVADVESALQARKLVERAKEMLMERDGLSDAEAFPRLQSLARDREVSLRAAAEHIVSAAEDARDSAGA